MSDSPYREPGYVGDAIPQAWRDDGLAVVPLEGCELPDRCVVCDAAADGYRWTGRDLVEVPLCARHRVRARRGGQVARAGVVLAPLTLVAFLTLGSLLPGLPCLGLLGAGMLLSALLIIGGRLMPNTPVPILPAREGVLRLEVGRRFLSRLPPRDALPPSSNHDVAGLLPPAQTRSIPRRFDSAGVKS